MSRRIIWQEFEMLSGRVCIVTGASRGVGKGIAAAFGSAGATVYVTGRSAQPDASPFGATVFATAEEVTRRGGRGIAVVCDHSDDDQVRELFARVQAESGRLDILVNNAAAIPDTMTDPGAFWTKPLDYSELFDVGLRSYYTSSWFAAPMLIRNGGVIANTSSPAAFSYVHGPAYGASRAGVDKLAHDMAHDFKPFGVCVVSLWLGLVKTEQVMSLTEKYGHLLGIAESPEYAGLIINALFEDPDRMTQSGKVHIAAELAQHYHLKDIHGSEPPSSRGFLGGPPEYSSVVVE
jgi:NAD(P)-dependent dehydrogenase (short-subunit alcohol dehydrogenase family)